MTFSSSICTSAKFWAWQASFLLLLTNNGASQSIIKNLPGFSGDLPFKLETGYVSVGKFDELQMFYYFVESERSPENDPLLLWITGGPRCSSFYGLVYEIGPISFQFGDLNKDPLTLVTNPYAWTKLANIIFLDAPAGTGFSYSTTLEGYISSDTLHATRAYEFLKRWLVTHPQFLANPLYISGDSFSGKIVPIIVQHITDDIEAGTEPPLNLKGYIIGNPATNTKGDVNSRIEYAHRMALISDRIYESTTRNCKGEYVDVDPNNQLCLNSLQAFQECTGRLDSEHILAPLCPRANDYDELTVLEMNWNWKAGISHPVEDTLKDFPSSLQLCREDRIRYSVVWANDINVRKALNIREGTKGEWAKCNRTTPYTFDIPSSLEYHRNLSKKSLRALVYSGDHDMAIPYISTLAWIESLNLTLEDDWKPWFSDDQVAGYTIYYSNKEYNLTYATIKGGGHTAPEYNPKECFDMFNRWLGHSPI
ncbi:serine carboxypeptidase-like 7 [Pyrus x bretschneideri]|uniref:serine carboxypeptidase-like 7 n=1 Tax=Pyrus x bretschneideri TaxID=225117 RepID=UPI002030EC04|nr:serine carboxypeptidase-like 7 [Pyrus x bretschneideri]